MDNRGIKGAFTRDLAETLIGGLILRILLPIAIAAYGVWTIFRGEFVVRNTSIHGTPAIFYGAAFVAFGLGTVGYPTMAEIQEGRVSRPTMVRMWCGIVLVGLLMIAATASQFL